MNINKEIKRHETMDARRKISWNITCFSVSEPRALSKEKTMAFVKNMGSKNHHGKKKHSGISGFGSFSTLRKNETYGACDGKDGSPNCSNISGVTPFVMIFWSTFIGSRALIRAVLIIVMAIDIFFLPFSVMLPKVIFLNKTEFLSCCSAQLFVGEMAGFFRKMKSSFLNFIRRFRILSVSWCDKGSCRYNFLNLFMMSFLPERYSSGVNATC